MIITDFMLHGSVPTLMLQPNPTTGRITLTATETLGPSQVTIYDNSGRSVFRHAFEEIKAGQYPLDLSHLADGSYVANFSTSLGSMSQRIRIMR